MTRARPPSWKKRADTRSRNRRFVPPPAPATAYSMPTQPASAAAPVYGFTSTPMQQQSYYATLTPGQQLSYQPTAAGAKRQRTSFDDTGAALQSPESVRTQPLRGRPVLQARASAEPGYSPMAAYPPSSTPGGATEYGQPGYTPSSSERAGFVGGQVRGLPTYPTPYASPGSSQMASQQHPYGAYDPYASRGFYYGATPTQQMPERQRGFLAFQEREEPSYRTASTEPSRGMQYRTPAQGMAFSPQGQQQSYQASYQAQNPTDPGPSRYYEQQGAPQPQQGPQLAPLRGYQEPTYGRYQQQQQQQQQEEEEEAERQQYPAGQPQ